MQKRVIEDGIRFLIGDHGKVVIPELGIFIGRYVSARFDPIEGTISPPTLSIQLSPDKGENPTLLVEYYSEKMNCTYRDAEEAVKNYGAEISEVLQAKEIVTMEGIGRLYFDFQNELKFVQDNGNRLFQSFGLPVLEFNPISRSENRLNTIRRDSRSLLKKKESFWKKSHSQLMSTDFLPITVGLGAFMVILAIFLLVPKQNANFSKELADKRTKSERTNIKPEATPVKAVPSPEELATAEEKLTAEVEAVFEEEQKADEVSEEVAAPKTIRQSIIIVGVYSQRQGIDLRNGQIKKLGYTPYEDISGGLTRVGLIVNHETAEDLEIILQEIHKEITPKAWIL